MTTRQVAIITPYKNIKFKVLKIYLLQWYFWKMFFNGWVCSTVHSGTRRTDDKSRDAPALAEPTPLRRRHVLRLTHSIARNHPVMNLSVFGRTDWGIYESWQRVQWKREKESQNAAETKKEHNQCRVSRTRAPQSQSSSQSDCQQLWRQPELEINPELSRSRVTQFYCLCTEAHRSLQSSFSMPLYLTLYFSKIAI